MPEKPWNFKVDKPIDYPGCYMFMGTDSQSPEGIVVRKTDGTWWEVIEKGIGDQIVNERSLNVFRGWFDQVQAYEQGSTDSPMTQYLYLVWTCKTPGCERPNVMKCLGVFHEDQKYDESVPAGFRAQCGTCKLAADYVPDDVFSVISSEAPPSHFTNAF